MMHYVRLLVMALLLVTGCGASLASPSQFLSCSPAICQQLEQLSLDFDQGLADVTHKNLAKLIATLNPSNNPDDLVSAHFYKGHFARSQSAYDDALQAFETALHHCQQPRQIASKAFILGEMAKVYRFQGNLQAALEHAYQALQLYQQHHHLSGVAWQQVTVGSILVARGQYEPALAVLQQVAKNSHQYEDAELTGQVFYYIGVAYLQLQQLELAGQYLDDALEYFDSAGTAFYVASSYFSLGELNLQRSDTTQARTQLNKALGLFAEINAPVMLHKAQSLLGLIEITAGEADVGQAHLNTAMAFARQHSATKLEAYLHLYMARGLRLANQPEQAFEHVLQGEQMAISQQRAGLHTEFLKLKAQLLFEQQDYQQAYEAQQQSYAMTASLANQARLMPIIQQSALLQVQRQAQSIELLEHSNAAELAQAEQRNLRNMLILGSVITLMLLLFLLFSRYAHYRQNMWLRQQVRARTIELESKNQQLQEAFKSLEQASLRDPLTGLYNRYYLDTRLPGEFRRAQHACAQAAENNTRADTDLLCFLMDIDNFKQINDEYGHLSGDRVLVQFSTLIQEVFRDTDLQIRWGGEEFLVICRHANRASTEELAERFRQTVAAHVFILADARPLRVTCCIGFSVLPLDPHGPFNTSWSMTFALIDYCLYAAKLSGKNCWVGVREASEQQAGDTDQPGTAAASVLSEKFNLAQIKLATSLNNIASIQWPEDT
ncbi:diguanylate cyclase [Salinimonas marina]|uniref:diguanylate cyclase n=1 Tax=Salinimonas marina TaxID=2785918 RepID=A0A7S9HDL1_9ALTE|nr:GGDEF domain-containing protein [Salinimonas marina]QPG06274.1 diguanylate cyclase [Salinimonas marina]